MQQSIALGVVHGRFQPPHNGHVRYILAALDRAEHVLIGICTPTICTEAEAVRTGYPCAPHQNPFTYEERAGMLQAALDEANVPREHYSFLPFPSDYANVHALVPENAVFLMSVTGPSDGDKIRHIQSLGFAAETVLDLSQERTRDASGYVRANASTEAAWEHMVPKSVADYMKTHGLVERLGK